MPTMTPDQRRTRERVETVIGLMAPFLNVVLAAGERISRMVEPEDHEYYPPRSADQPPTSTPATRTPHATED